MSSKSISRLYFECRVARYQFSCFLRLYERLREEIISFERNSFTFSKISLTYYKSSIVKRNASDKDHIYPVRFLIDVYFNYSLSQATRF